MYTKKLKKLNKNNHFTEKEIKNVNKFLVKNHNFISKDKAYEIDDIISELFYKCFTCNNPELEFPAYYHLAGEKVSISQRYKNNIKKQEWGNLQTNYSNFFDQVGDLKRIYIYLEKTGNYKLSNLLNCIIENIIYNYKKDKINISCVCKKMNISRPTFYRYMSELKRIYNGK